MNENADSSSPPPMTAGRTATLSKIENSVNQLVDLAHRLVCVNNYKIGFLKKENIPDQAMDIFQSTVLKVLEKADQYDPRQPFEAWFTYWAILEIRHAHQKTNGRSQTKIVNLNTEVETEEYHASQNGAPEPEFQPIQLAEVTSIVLTRIQSILNDEDYQLFLAKNFHFQENAEIASTFGFTKAQVAVKATRIMKKIRAVFTPQDWHDLRFGADKPQYDRQPVRSGANS